VVKLHPAGHVSRDSAQVPLTLFRKVNRAVAASGDLERLRALARRWPVDLLQEWRNPEVTHLLAEAAALIETSGTLGDYIKFATSMDFLGGMLDRQNTTKLTNAFLRTLARAERDASDGLISGVAARGSPFSIAVTVREILGIATTTIRFVDPFADIVLLDEFAVLAPEGIQTQVLLSNKSAGRGFGAVAQRWRSEHGAQHPLEARAADNPLLHDRLIILDGRRCVAVGQSFNKLAERSMSYFLEVHPAEVASETVEFYDWVWEGAAPV